MYGPQQFNHFLFVQESHRYIIAIFRVSIIVTLLVVDEDTDDFFARLGITPSSKHLDGSLEYVKPVPQVKVATSKKKEKKEKKEEKKSILLFY